MSEEKCSMKNKIKYWCRYWHFNSWGVVSDNDGHRNYLDVVSKLDDIHDTDAFNDDHHNLEEAWKVVLSNINKCTDDQLKDDIEPYCHSRKD